MLIDERICFIRVQPLFSLFSVNCWPNETGSGCDVNIEYELEREEMELSDVTILIPLP